MTSPLVSLLIISYNQHDLIRETLDSAVGQDYANLEVVVADDGSTDGTADIIAEYGEHHPGRVKPLIGGPNLGITANANRGLRACRGEYVAWMGGDDILDREKIRAQVRWMEEHRERVLCGHDVEIYEISEQRVTSLFSELVPMRRGRGAAAIVRRGVPYAAMSIMIRASALPAKGFDERLAITSDWLLYIEVLARGGVYGYVDGILGRLRRHDRNITRTAFQQRFDDVLCTLAIVEAAYPDLLKDVRFGRALQLCAKAKWHLVRGDLEAARRYACAAMKPPSAFGWHALSVLASTYSERIRTIVTRRLRRF